jgi:hypothetical protein
MSPSNYKSAKTASEVWYKIQNPESASNPVFVFGHAVHTLMLEPELFDVLLVVDEKENYPVQEFNKDGSVCMRSVKNQTYRIRLEMDCQMKGKELLMEQQWQQIKEMLEAYPKFNPVISKTLLDPDGAMIEMSFYGKVIFSDEGIFEGFGDIPDLDYKPAKNEMLVKTRPDYLRPDAYYLDIKTCESAYPKFFANDCLNYGYDIQAAFIMDFCNFMLNATVDTFIFLAMEKSKPYQSVPMFVPNSMITTGRAKYQTRLEKLFKTMNNGYLVYADKPDDVFVTIPFPKYATLNEDSVINW